jgi:pantetheine-phosphate adenylyltransferase
MGKTVICPGSFDPLTIGHLDIIKRSSKLFDNVIVVVMKNFNKKNKFLKK